MRYCIMEAEGSATAIHEQAEVTQPEQLQLQSQLEHHLQPQIEQMPMEGVQGYEQHMQGAEGHLQHPEAHLQGRISPADVYRLHNIHQI